MAPDRPFSDAVRPIILFGGQGSSHIFSPSSSGAAKKNAKRGLHSALLLSKWHVAFLEEIAALGHNLQPSLQLNPSDFLHQNDLLEIPQRLHRNPLIQSITICLYQLLHYVAELEDWRLGKTENSTPKFLETTGICCGLLSAAVVAASKDLSDAVSYGIEALRLAFSIGVRVMLQTQAHTKDADGELSCCLIVMELRRAEVAAELDSFRNKTGLEGVKISALSTPTLISITGPPSDLVLFQEHIAPRAVSKFSHVHGWYHGGESLQSTVEEVSEDIERRKIGLPGTKDLQVPIRSTFDGSVLDSGKEEENLALWIVKHMLLYPVDWVETCRSIHLSLEARANQDSDLSHDLLCFGPSSESLFMELRSQDRSSLLNLIDMSTFKARKLDRDRLSGVKDDDIAIVGMGVHLPRGHGDQELWETLSKGLSAVSEIAESRFVASTYHTSSEDGGSRTMATRHGAFLDGIWEFDNEYFGISPREAKSMDPQQRVLLHTSQAALDDAGYAPESSPSFSKATFGCYMGLATGDYTDNLKDDIDVFYSTGTLRAFHSGKISFINNFSGPSIVTDTACSSSLVSIYNACRALRNGDCTAALAGGVNTISSPDMYLGLSRGHFLSSSGGCKPFDAGADGYCRAEGCAVFVLKRLSSAIAENDRIHGIIKSVEVNQSGTAASITHPDSDTQRDLFQKSLQNAEVDPASITVVEAHGTGTKAGDPCELASLNAVFGQCHSPANPLFVSSIKGNIGHCEAASGAAGLAKLLLEMRHGVIPVQASFDNPNPLLEGLDDGNIVIPTTNRPWKASTEPRRALLNNFGAAGSNAALILEEYPSSSADKSESKNRSSFLFNLSAKNLKGLSNAVAEHKEFLQNCQTLSLADVCYTATARRTTYNHQISLCCSSIPDLVSKLEAFQPALVKPSDASKPLIFVFSGQGSLYKGMGQVLFEQSLHFQRTILRCEAILKGLGFPSFVPFIQSSSQSSDNGQEALLSQCACFALEYSLASLLISCNIVPDFVIGHSLGEYAALVVSGALTLEDGIRIVATRANLMEEHCAQATSGMIACKIPPAEADCLIRDDEKLSGLVVACRNSDEDCVISGPSRELDHLGRVCKNRKIKTTQLQVPFGYHSSAMDPIVDQLKEIGDQVCWSAPKIHVGSGVFGRLLKIEDLDGDYFANHTRKPVQFVEALRDIQAQGASEDSIAVEIGPHPISLPMLRGISGANAWTLLATLQKKKDDWISMNETLAKIAPLKKDIKWRGIFEGSGAKVISLPGYPLRGETFCVPVKEHRQMAHGENADSAYHMSDYVLLRKYALTNPLDEESYQIETSMATLSSYIAGHKVGGVAICPASVHHELVLEAIMESVPLKENQRPILKKLQFPQPLVESTYASSDPIYVRVWRRSEDVFQVGVCIKSPDHFQEGAVSTAELLIKDSSDVKMQAIKDRALALRQIAYIQKCDRQSTFQPDILYNSIFTRVVSYSKTYQALKRFTVSSTRLEGEGTFKLPQESRPGTYVTSPIFLDTLFHAAGFMANLNVPTDEICICGRVDSVEILQKDIDMSQEFSIYCGLMDDLENMYLADSYALSASGEVVAVVRGIEFRRLRLKTFQSVLNSIVSDAKEAQSTHTQTRDSSVDTASIDDSETSSPAGLETPETPQDDEDSISATVLRAVSDASGFPIDRLQSSVPLENLGIDSMMQIEITSALKQAFPGNGTIDHQSLSNCDTIQALEDVLRKSLSPKASVPDQDIPTSDLTKTSGNDKDTVERPKREHKTIDSTSENDNPILIQHSTSDNSPIFLIHDGSGQVQMYGRMGRIEDRAIYAFRDFDGESDSKKNRGLSDMAKEYASGIMAMGVTSVILGGWSFGGVVALEIAVQLIEADVTVEGLILIDSPYPENHQPLPKEITSAVCDSIFSRPENGPKAEEAKSRTLEAFTRHASMLGAYSPPHNCNLLTVMLRSSEVIDTKKKYGLEYPWLSKQETRDDAVSQWKKLVGGRLETLTIPGTHFEPFDQDKIAQTTAQIAAACDIIDDQS